VDLEFVPRPREGPGRGSVGVHFTGLSPCASRELSQFLIDGFTRRERRLARLTTQPASLMRVRRSTHVRDLLRLHGLHRRQTLSVYQGDEPLPARLHVRAVGNGGGHFEIGCDRDPQLDEGRTYSFLLPASGAALLFEATVRRRENGSALLSFPEELLQGGFRGSGRLRPTNGDGVVTSFLHRRGDGRRTARRAFDLSEDGLSFPFRAGEDILFPGDRLDDLRLELPTGTVAAQAVVRGIATRADDGGPLCGIELVAFERAVDRERWRQYVFSRTYPRTLDDDPRIARLAWDVLDSSEYLALWTRPDERERLEREFLSRWSAPARVPGRLIVLREEQRTVGTFATSRMYPKTWLLHSLGVDREERRKRRYFLDAARELYTAMLALLKGEAAPYFVLFVQKEKRWTELLYGQFVEALPMGAPSVYDEYALFKCPSGCSAPADPPGPKARRVEPADSEAMAAVSEGLGRLLTPLERDAYAYGGEEGTGLRAPAGGSDSPVQREVFVARDDRGLRAALVAESGSAGVNVFGLLDNCRIFSFSAFEDPDEEKAVAEALLTAASRFFAARGVDQFIVFATSDAQGEAARAVCGQLVSTGVRWLASCALLPAWLNYVDEVLQVLSLDARSEVQHAGQPA
jgi:hypothetical protein